MASRPRFGRERVILTEHGTPVAAIISVEELADSAEQAEAILATHAPVLARANVVLSDGQER